MNLGSSSFSSVVKLSYGHQVKYDVIAKSILAGKTQFYIKDETFDYRLNQIYSPPIRERVAKIRGKVDISFTPNEQVYELHLYIRRTLTGRRQWHPTPVLLPGKSPGQGSLVGCSPWGR